jgi:hypothetical protein
MNAAVEYAEFAETIACRQDSIEVEPSPKSARRYSMEFRLVFELPPRLGSSDVKALRRHRRWTPG